MIEFELMGLVAIRVNWKHFLFHGKSSIRDSSLVGGKAKKSDKLCVSLHRIPGEIHCRIKWKHLSGRPKGSSKTQFQHCNNSCNDLLCIRTIQGHTGGDVIALELGQCRNSFQTERNQFSQRMLIQFEVNLPCGTHRWWRESKEG